MKLATLWLVMCAMGWGQDRTGQIYQSNGSSYCDYCSENSADSAWRLRVSPATATNCPFT